MYTTHHIFPVLTINHLVNHNGKPTIPHKLTTGMKPLVSNLRILFFMFVVQKSTAHVDINALNMRHQPKKGLWSIFVGIPQDQKGWIIYVPITRNMVSPHDVAFEKKLVR